MSTNILINSRSMNGIITISDGSATLENGDLTCDDINSSTINSGIFTCRGEFRCNLVGPYTIPTLVSSDYGSLISYGNSSGNGATDFTNYQSTYNITKGGFNFWNKSSTQTLTNLAIIDNSQTYFKSQLTGCTAETPLNTTSIVNKSYVDDNFLDRTNNLTQNVNGLKTFSNNTNFTGSLLSRTNIKLSEYENTAATNTITLAFPMSETIALRTTPLTSNPMTINLPLLTNNERGYVFTFNKLFDTSNATNRNFPVTFNTSGGQGIYSLYDQFGTPTTNTTLLSVEKIQCKLAVGWVGSLLYWIEQTDFSTYDRYKLTEWGNATTTNTLTLTLPLPPTIALRVSTNNPMTITLPTLTVNERGKIFTFIKLNPTINYNVTFNTSSGQWIFPLNNLTGSPTSNTTIFPSNKKLTKLAVGWFGTFTYWIEASDYSTFDVEQNNLIYARLASPNAFTNTNTFNSFLPTSTLTPSSDTQLITKKFADDTYVDRTNNLNQDINGLKTFLSNLTCSSALIVNTILAPSSGDNFIYTNLSAGSTIKIGNLSSTNVVEGDTTFSNNLVSNNITSPSVTGTNNIYTNLSLDGGIINVGARGSNININCNLNIIESVYGNITKITTMNQEGDSCRFTNNGSTNGNFIFTINEGSTYNTLVINKMSVDVAGDALIDGNLILYDTTQLSTKNVIIGMVGNDLFFTPYLNVPSSTYNFKVSDSASTITTPLIINSTNTTIANRLHLNAGSRYYSGTTNYTEVLQTGAQLTIKPVSNNGSLALFSSAPVSGTQTQQLLINNSGVNATTISSTNIFSTNYNTSSQIIDFGFSITTGNCNICASISTGNVNIGNATAGSFKTNIRGSLFSTGQATFQNFCPKSETNPAVANDLVKLSYLQNNFCDLSTTQSVGGEKTFTGDITAQNINCNLALYFTDLGNNVSPNKPQIYMLNDVGYFDTLTTYDNYWEFVCVGNIQLSISQYSTEIKNPLIANEAATFSKQATFNSFCPKTDTDPAVANDLVKLSYLQNNFCNLSTSQQIGGEKTFTDDLTAPNIFCNTALYFRDIDASIKKALIFHQADIVYFDTLTVFDNYWKFKCKGVDQLIISELNTTIENKLNCNSELIHKETHIMNKIKTISTTSPPAFEFPLAERWMFTTTGSTQINVTLPELTLSSQAGFNFSFFKTGSVTNSVLFTCQGTNKIRGINSITDLTSLTRISGTGTTGGFYTAEVSTGNFVWISY